MTPVAPYGTWRLPISAEMVSVGGVTLSQPRLEDGSVYWLESRPSEGGRSVLMSAAPFSEAVEITPQGFNVRTTVHEYGGGAHLIHRGTAFFSNFADQRLYRQELGADPAAITPESGGRDRYADGRITPDERWLICVRERHPDPDDPSGVTNEMVAIPPEGSAEPLSIRSGRDFYSTPRISPDGSMLCWLEWDLPWMPWDGCEVYVADLADVATLQNVRRSPAGRARSRSSSRRGARPATCTSCRTGPAGGTSTGSATARWRRSILPRRSSAGPNGCSGCPRTASSETGGSRVSGSARVCSTWRCWTRRRAS